jgi:hypothetical protein
MSQGFAEDATENSVKEAEDIMGVTGLTREALQNAQVVA